MPALLGLIVPPAPEVLVDDLPGRKVRGQQAPGTAPTQDREDRSHDLALAICLRPPTGLGGLLTQRSLLKHALRMGSGELAEFPASVKEVVAIFDTSKT